MQVISLNTHGVKREKIARLNADGTLDNSFYMTASLQGNSADSNAYIHKLLVQADGKILVGGNFSTINGKVHSLIARLNADGSVDESMISYLDTIYNNNSSQISAMALQSDGKIIIGIQRDDNNFTGDLFTVCRLNTDGSIDRNFKISPEFSGYYSPNTIVIQADDKIIVGGYFEITSDGITYNNLIRLNSDGSIDKSFMKEGGNSRGADGEVVQIQLLKNGKLLVSGYFEKYNRQEVSSLIRVDAEGTLDKSFAASASLFNPDNIFSYCLVADDAGNVYTGTYGYSSDYTVFNSLVYKLNAFGALDSTYNTGTGANSAIFTMALNTDGKLLIGGSFTAFNGQGRNHIARLAPESVLPLSWLKINAKPINNTSVLVGWSVATETTTSFYTIERSYDGLAYKEAGMVKATGNTGLLLYNFIDNNVTAAGSTTIYYRVKQTSFDGANSYSPVVPVSWQKGESIKVSPNPARDNIWLQISSATDEQTTIRITNSEGKQLMVVSALIPAGSSSRLLPMARYSAGIYYIVVENKKAKQSFKVVKE